MTCDECGYYKKECNIRNNNCQCDIYKRLKNSCQFCDHYVLKCRAYGSLRNYVKGCKFNV
jgi:hypothetical protein